MMPAQPKSPAQQPSQTFNHENTKQSYSIIMVSLASIRAYIWGEFAAVSQHLNISADEFESMYDWIIAEAVGKVLSITHARLLYHYRHDVYKCAYDILGHFAEYAISKQIASHNLRFLDKEPVKVMVAGDNLILARGVLPHDRL